MKQNMYLNKYKKMMNVGPMEDDDRMVVSADFS